VKDCMRLACTQIILQPMKFIAANVDLDQRTPNLRAWFIIVPILLAVNMIIHGTVDLGWHSGFLLESAKVFR